MASNKKPSIYSDRGSIGTADELDEYGVWVKSEPRDLSSDIDDSMLPAEESVNIDESFKFDDAVLDTDEALDISSLDDIDFPDDNITIGDDDGLKNPADDLYDFKIPESDSEVKTEEAAEGVSVDEVNFDDFDIAQMPDETAGIIADDSFLDEKSTFNDSDEDELLLDEPQISAISADWAKEESAEISEDIGIIETDDLNINTDEIVLVNDVNSAGGEAIDEIISDETISIDDIDNPIAIEDTSETISIDDIDNSITIEDTDETISLDDIDSAITIEDDIVAAAGVNDFEIPTVKSIEKGIDNLQVSYDAAKSGGNELSSQLLQRIAEELSSIRSELTDLKKEFAIVRSGALETEKTEPQAAGDRSGFFSEEDDEKISLTGDELSDILGTEGKQAAAEETAAEETAAAAEDDEDEAIALTGDELDNILNSADFTEESGTEETPEADFPLYEDPADLPLNSLNDSPDINVPMDAELEQLSEDGAEPLTFPPEDTSYLEESDEIAIGGSHDEEIFDDDLIFESGIVISDLSDEEAASDETLNDDLIMPDDIIIDDFTSEEIAAGLSLSDDLVIDDIPSDDLAIGDMDITLEEPAPEELSADDLVIDEIPSDDLAIGGMDITLEEPAPEELSADDLVIDEIPSDDLAIDDIDITLEEPAAEEPAAEELSTEEVSADELSLDEFPKDEPLADDLSLVDFTGDDLSIDDLSLDDDLVIDDLSDAVIDEPELSTNDIDLTEPSIDIDLSSSIEESDLSLDSFDEPSIEEEEEEVDISVPELEIESSVFDDMNFDTSEEDVLFEEAAAAPVTQAPPAAAPQAPAPITQAPPAPIPAPVTQPAPAAPAVKAPPASVAPAAAAGMYPVSGGQQGGGNFQIPSELKSELRNILSYMDQLLESLPEQKIEEFAKSNYFDSYKKLFKELGLV